MIYQKFCKRLFDFCVALFLLILLSPLLLFIAALLLCLNRSVFFFQTRPGQHEKPFVIYKFKTMSDEQDRNGNLLPDAERLTPLGRIIRLFSLDELLQLVNVVKGDMSLVGPRPLLMEYLPLYSKEQARRHEVRPGITGLAQVNGRNNLSWEERFARDVEYVDNLSFWLDVKIIFRTIIKAFSGAGVSEDGQATVRKFTGNQ